MKRIILMVLACLSIYSVSFAAEPAAESTGARPAVTNELSIVVPELKSKGIYKGKELWLKYPRYGLPGLTKVKVKEIIIDEKPSSWNGYNYKYITLKVDCDDYEISELDDFYDVEAVVNLFYLKNVGANWSKKVKKAIEKGEIFIGMTDVQVDASFEGAADINKTVGPWGVHEQWVYGNGLYLYFRNGKLTSYQYSE